jgi:N-acetylmuramoyl-L-alanine amidase
MSVKRVVISSGHSKFVSGAVGLINEVTEARRVVSAIAQHLTAAGLQVVTFNDDVSKTQAANLNAIVNFHNRQNRDLDVSVHFNAHVRTEQPRGVEVLHKTQGALAAKVSHAISNASGLIDRSAKVRSNLSFLNRTRKPAILLEICFVDSATDVRLYRAHFEAICRAAAEAISGKIVTAARAT